MLVDGKWSENWQPVQATDAKGGFVRQTSSFRNWVTPDGAPGPTRRRRVQGRGGALPPLCGADLPLGVADADGAEAEGPRRRHHPVDRRAGADGPGVEFGDHPGATRDTINGATYLHEIYTRADPHITGRATVPVLWDKQRQTIVNNESADILRMLNTGFGALASDALDLYPEPLREEIDALNDEIYPRLNNGVYRAGFATTQQAYDEAFEEVFADARRAGGGALPAAAPSCSAHSLVETDIRLFVTLIRFDAAYHGLFKCNRAAPRRLPRAERLAEARARYSRRARDRQHRPHQAWLLFDQGAQPERHRSLRPRSLRAGSVNMPRPLIVLLHGVHADGANLAPAARFPG